MTLLRWWGVSPPIVWANIYGRLHNTHTKLKVTLKYQHTHTQSVSHPSSRNPPRWRKIPWPVNCSSYFGISPSSFFIGHELESNSAFCRSRWDLVLFLSSRWDFVDHIWLLAREMEMVGEEEEEKRKRGRWRRRRKRRRRCWNSSGGPTLPIVSSATYSQRGGQCKSIQCKREKDYTQADFEGKYIVAHIFLGSTHTSYLLVNHRIIWVFKSSPKGAYIDDKIAQRDKRAKILHCLC